MNIYKKIILILLVLLAYFFVPIPKETNSQETDNQTSLPIKIIYESEKRNIEEEIKHIFGDSWRIAYAVMMSEGGGIATAKNINPYECKRTSVPYSVDNGYWQINDCYHPTVTLECAQDVECSTAYTYKLSKQGTDWSAWHGYKNGSYLEYI